MVPSREGFVDSPKDDMSFNSYELAEISTLIDHALADFERDHRVIFGSDGARRSYRYIARSGSRNAWNASRPCVVDGCDQPSIVRSHSIQKAGPLESIAEDQHVLQPVFDGSEKLTMRSVGVNSASVFPGFCPRHEQMFSKFEQRKCVQSDADIALQMYRVVARELVRARFEVQQLASSLSSYKELRDQFMLSRVRLKYPQFTLRSVIFTKDLLEQELASQLQACAGTIEEIVGGIFPELGQAISGLGGDCAVTHISCPDLLPVCLSGRGNIALQGTSGAATLFLCVLPGPSGTDVFLAARSQDAHFLKAYVAHHMYSRLSILSAVESWMIYQTDHWFITPSVWTAIPEERRDVLLHLAFTDHSLLGHECPMSIFDELRHKMLADVGASDELARAGAYGQRQLDHEACRLQTGMAAPTGKE